MTSKLAASPRKRGAQPSNTNALKHGFYSRFFNLAEIQAISKIDPSGLKNEIDLIRIISRRIIDLWNSASSADIPILSDLLIRSTAAVAALSRTQAIINRMNDINPLSELYAILEEFETSVDNAPEKTKGISRKTKT